MITEGPGETRGLRLSWSDRCYHRTMNRALTSLATMLLTAGMLAVTPSAYALDEGAEIPGVPFVGSVVSAEVGGTIADRVYSLEVAAGTVMVVTLQGESGAELGLYLFGSEATSVVTSDVIASSARPGASQMVRVVIPSSETIYLNVNGRNDDRKYQFVLTISAVVDKTPPRISLARTAPHSRSTAVCARVGAEDSLAGVSSVAVVPAGGSYAPDWQSYEGVGRYCGSYEVPDGSVAVRVLARNQLGFVSSVKAGSTLIDSVQPQVGSPTPRISALLQARPTIRWRFNEPIKGISSRAVNLIAFDQLGNRLSGSSAVSADGTLLSWTATRSIAPGVLVNVQVPGVRDLAGNVLAEIEPFSAFRKERTSITLTTLGATGGTLRVKVTVSRNLLRQTVRLLARTEGQADVLLKTVKIVSLDTFVRIQPAGSVKVVASWSGSETLNRAQDSVLVAR